MVDLQSENLTLKKENETLGENHLEMTSPTRKNFTLNFSGSDDKGFKLKKEGQLESEIEFSNEVLSSARATEQIKDYYSFA